ncbi:MAG: mannose-phosphate guanylyltransferase [Candidatus Sumerlaeota bacterium]|nr:mannose-phosphate guanylyltransferase [Candidatus Sumerlaeota bacterium]
MPQSTRVAVIMAGGSGERFWPLSRCQHPKQLLRLTGTAETMLEQAVSRIAPLIAPERVIVATSRVLCDAIRAGDSRLPAVNVIAEPCKRNTTGCLIWAAATLLARHGEQANVSMAVLTADHLIGRPDDFRRCVDAALTAAETRGALVTIGITPTHAETGYGYVEQSGECLALPGFDGVEVQAVRSFKEKPAPALAEEYVASGRYLWNSGMFFWRLDVFLAELEKASPVMATTARAIAEALRAENDAEAERLFETLESISIDYALMERSTNVLVVRSLFPWDDVGSWDSLYRIREADGQGNITEGDPVLVDSHGSLVLNAAGDAMAVGVVGLDNVVVVTTADAVLVVHRDRVQDVKKIVAELQARKAGQV